jgi:hypothetical protein
MKPLQAEITQSGSVKIAVTKVHKTMQVKDVSVSLALQIWGSNHANNGS